jgi:toxin HigB-1
MDVEFENDDLDRLEVDKSFNAGFAPEVVKGFRKAMQVIRAASDSRDLTAMRSLSFEKLKGDRAGQYSLRLNKQWRLIVRLKEAEGSKTVVVIEIVDYH